MGHEESSCFLKNDKNQEIICSNNLFVVILQKTNKTMRSRSYAFFVSVMILLGCSQLSSCQHQLELAEAVIEDNPDSALVLLNGIPASLVSDGEERALYNLLMTEAAQKLYKPFVNDSLINYSIDYYSKSNNVNRLATANLYKGGLYYHLKNIDKATFYAEQAEELTMNSDDELLKCKIYEMLAIINFNTKNHQLCQHYANLLLESSIKLNAPCGWLWLTKRKPLSAEILAIQNKRLMICSYV